MNSFLVDVGFGAVKLDSSPMLNESVDFKNLYLIITASGILFLSVMWGGFYYFTRLKKKDEEKRRKFRNVVAEAESED
ncbi:MAG: hypothetical protein WCG75_05030 [Armatimonadota bacterium]